MEAPATHKGKIDSKSATSLAHAKEQDNSQQAKPPTPEETAKLFNDSKADARSLDAEESSEKERASSEASTVEKE